MRPCRVAGTLCPQKSRRGAAAAAAAHAADGWRTKSRGREGGVRLHPRGAMGAPDIERKSILPLIKG
eukprot:scaffold2091_cov361-Prasinococcus_capsulatus_cf.AAC.5